MKPNYLVMSAPPPMLRVAGKRLRGPGCRPFLKLKIKYLKSGNASPNVWFGICARPCTPATLTTVAARGRCDATAEITEAASVSGLVCYSNGARQCPLEATTQCGHSLVTAPRATFDPEPP
jgi:hypothetical protein